MQRKHRKFIVCAVILLLAGIAAGAVLLYLNGGGSEASLEAEEESQEALYVQIAPDANNNKEETDAGAEASYLADAQAVNAETAAWITIPDTRIDYPVVQTTDNSYYLSHDFEQQASSLGVPFLDYRNTSDFSDFNSIVYGHHITKGRMFTDLEKFKDEDFFKDHPAGTLTLPDRIYTVEFLCCAVVQSDCELYQTICVTKPQKETFLDVLDTYAVCARGYDREDIMNEKLLVLSTCSYEYDDARTVLVGVLTGE